MEQEHIIQTQVFEIGFPHREEVTVIQNRLSQLFSSRLSTIMSGLFDKHIPPDLILKIDTLEIDLGSVSYSHFEDELTERFTAELEKELTDRLVSLKNGPSDTTQGMQASGFKTGFADLLEYYLTNGSMPWWANARSVDPEAMLSHLLSENPDAVKQLLLKTGQNANVRRRLVYQFSEKVIRSVITLLEPEEAAFIFEYHRDIIRVQQQKQVIRNESSGFEKEVLVFILSAILVDRGSHFNKKMFVKSTLQQMAAHYSVSYENILFLFSSTVDTSTDLIKKTDYLPVIILELFSEHLHAQATEPPREIPVMEKKAGIRDKIGILRHYLFLGSVPAWSGSYGEKDLRDLFSELLATAPLMVNELLVSVIRQKSAKARFIQLADEQIFASIIKSLEPKDAMFILEYAGVFVKFLGRMKDAGKQDAEVTRSVREFILIFLLEERNPVYNKQAFLESTIRQAAAQYNKSFRTLLVFLVQFISENERQQSDHTNLFYLVTGILKSQGTGFSGKIPGIPDEQKDQELPPAAHHILLRDLLNHFLLYGYLPWWGKDYAGGSPEKMLNGLIENFPEDALLLLKMAGPQPFARRRLLAQFSQETVLKLFKQLNGAAGAGELFHAFSRLSETHDRFGAGEDLHQAFLLALWNTYEVENYHRFNAPLFLEKVLLQLSFRTKTPVETILGIFKTFIRQHQSQELSGLLAQPLPSFLDPDRILDNFHISYSETQLIELLKSSLPANTIRDRELFLATSLDILSYFLTWNTLPDKLQHIQGAQQEALLRQLLVLLSSQNPSALKDLMKGSGRSSKAKMRVHEVLILETNTAERNAKNLLSEYTEQDILHYLQEHSPADQIHDTDLRKLLDSVLNKKNTAEKKEMLRLMLKAGGLTRILAWQFTDEKFYGFLKETTHGINTEAMALLKDLRHFLSSTISDTLEREKVQALLKEFSLYYFTRQNVDPRSSEFLSTFFKFLASRRHPGVSGFFSSLLESSAGIPDSSPLVISGKMKEIQAQLRQHINFENRNQALVLELKRSGNQALIDLIGGDTFQVQKPGTEILRNAPESTMVEEIFDQSPDKLPEDTREKIYLRNAGLILLHPFISTFFNRAGLIENGNFVTTEARHRAAYLLQYLVGDASGYAEHDMVLNKVLCGFPIQQPLLPGLTPSAQEMEIAQELLLEVTRQWDKLKNTSVAGLQASFLQRNAVLTQTEETWNMKVEQRGYDVLLQTLPWGFGMIRTPWMTKFLYVEWT